MASQNIIIPRNDLAIKKSYLVEIPLTNTQQGAQIKFLRNDVLNPLGTRSVKFTGLETFTSEKLLSSESGRPVVTNIEGPALAVTLVFKDVEFVKLYPYMGLNTNANYGMIRRLNNVEIDLTKSFITVLDASVLNTKSAIFNFIYE